ncbi:MAG: hypothetical protein JW730_02570 [Anaerolineales bacterium]|nr:hypothetical protein [Anaerolineales bacterium]
MFNKNQSRITSLLLITVVLISCGLLSTPNPTPEPIQLTDTPEATLTPVPPTITPTPVPPTATDEPSVIINLGPGRFGKPLWLEVVKGDYKITSGATLKAGSAIGVSEDWLTFPSGLAINVEYGEITLKGTTYPQGTKLLVDNQGSLMER